MLLSCELRKPIEKSACHELTLRATTYLVGQGQTMGHRRSKELVRPPSPRILVAKIGKLYLFVPAEGVLAHKTSPPLGHRQSPPLVLLPLPQWQSDQEVLVGQNQKQKKETLCKTEVSCDPLVCAVPMFGNSDGHRWRSPTKPCHFLPPLAIGSSMSLFWFERGMWFTISRTPV
jgi:hypothetical protein